MYSYLVRYIIPQECPACRLSEPSCPGHEPLSACPAAATADGNESVSFLEVHDWPSVFLFPFFLLFSLYRASRPSDAYRSREWAASAFSASNEGLRRRDSLRQLVSVFSLFRHSFLFLHFSFFGVFFTLSFYPFRLCSPPPCIDTVSHRPKKACLAGWAVFRARAETALSGSCKAAEMTRKKRPCKGAALSSSRPFWRVLLFFLALSNPRSLFSRSFALFSTVRSYGIPSAAHSALRAGGLAKSASQTAVDTRDWQRSPHYRPSLGTRSISSLIASTALVPCVGGCTACETR